MFFIILMRILRGTVRIKVSGGFPERFLNMCAYRGIDIWRLKKVDGILFGTVMAQNYKKMRHIAKKTGVKMRLEDKKGVPFIFHRYRRRPGIPVGAVIFVAFLVYMSGYIWSIEVRGLKTVKEKEIVLSLKDLGLTIGSKTKSFNTSDLRNRLLLANKELSWAAVNLEGSFAFVEVTEVEKVPDESERNQPSNIKAAIDGRIITMEVYSGTPVVKAGEAVVKGDLLVSGVVEFATGQSGFKRSNAKIIAETERTLTATIPLEQEIVRKTGQLKKRRVLELFGIKIPLFLGTVKGDYELKITEFPAIIDNVRLPLKVTEGKYFLTEKENVKYSTERAEVLARKDIEKQEKELLGHVVVKDRKEIVENNDNWVKITINYSCEENISVEENILINGEN